MMRCEICKESDPDSYEMSGLPYELNGIYHTILCPKHINIFKAFSRNHPGINKAHEEQTWLNSRKLDPQLEEHEAAEISRTELKTANSVVGIAEAWLESMKLVARSVHLEEQHDQER